jgi:hypothetical protein
MCGFIMLGRPNSNKKVYIFNGCTVSKTLIGRALTKLGFEAKPKKIQVEPSWGERVSKNGARKSDRLWV